MAVVLFKIGSDITKMLRISSVDIYSVYCVAQIFTEYDIATIMYYLLTPLSSNRV